MPIQNWHSARLQDPARFSDTAWRTTKGGIIYGTIKIPATINIVWGKLKGKDKPTDPPIAQALRFPADRFTVAEAKKFLKDNKIKYILFEPAAEEEVAAVVQTAKRLLEYSGSISLARPMEMFFSLQNMLSKAVSLKFGKDAFLHDFSDKEAIIGYRKSDTRPIDSWESGEYEKITYKLKNGEVKWDGVVSPVTKTTQYESLDDEMWKRLWKMESELDTHKAIMRKAERLIL